MRTFPIPPAVEWWPDELSQYHVNVHTAKIMSLGECAKALFLVDGPILTGANMQLQREQDLMGALSA